VKAVCSCVHLYSHCIHTVSKKTENCRFYIFNAPSSGDPCEFMHGLHIGWIDRHGDGAIFAANCMGLPPLTCT